MYTAIHRPVSVQIEQGKLPDGTDAQDIFTVGLVHQPDNEPQTFYGVYVPKSLQASLFDNDVLCLQMVELGSASSRALPATPKFVVFALKTHAGEIRIERPKLLSRALWWRIIGGGVAIVAGISLLFTENHFFGAFWLVLGTHDLRSAKEMLLIPAMEHFNAVRAPAPTDDEKNPLISP